MNNESANAIAQGDTSVGSRVPVKTTGDSPQNIPDLLAELYSEAPETLRPKLLEFLLRPVGPLAIVTIASGAFAHLLYRLRLNGVSISLDDAARITSDHVLQLARYVEQCSPPALMRIGSLISGSPVCLATMSGSALLVALSAWRYQRLNSPGT
jgi:hypothetical protein